MTEQLYPKRLISSEKKAEAVNEQVCINCIMTHRIGKEESLYTIGGEIDPEIINFDRFCGLSLNLLACNQHSIYELCHKDDVKFTITGERKKEFTLEEFENDEQTPDIKDIQFSINPELKVIGFVKKQFEEIEGIYPFRKNGKEDKEYQFKIVVEYKPNPVNVLHFEISLYGNHVAPDNPDGEFRVFKGRTSKKGYLDSIISKIKNRIIKNNFLFEV